VPTCKGGEGRGWGEDGWEWREREEGVGREGGICVIDFRWDGRHCTHQFFYPPLSLSKFRIKL